jgi:hypothetical protein
MIKIRPKQASFANSISSSLSTYLEAFFLLTGFLVVLFVVVSFVVVGGTFTFFAGGMTYPL